MEWLEEEGGCKYDFDHVSSFRNKDYNRRFFLNFDMKILHVYIKLFFLPQMSEKILMLKNCM